MMVGRRYWILIWYGFLLIGIVGGVASTYWGRRFPGRNLDEILRAVATSVLSIGMLLLLYEVAALDLLLGRCRGTRLCRRCRLRARRKWHCKHQKGNDPAHETRTRQHGNLLACGPRVLT